MKKGPTDADFHDTITEADPRVKVEELLPRELSKYYLLDGEFLEGFWQKTSVIKAGVEQISQLNLLSSLEKHIAQILPSTSGTGQETESFASKIQTFMWIEQSLDDDGNESFSQLLRWKENPNEVDGTRGSWTIQEGANNLFLINRNTGEKYKFMLDKIN